MLIAQNTYDPVESTEGQLDPLSLNPIADRLGNRLTPGIRERMRHPRFLTASVVGVDLCKGFADQVATDGISSPLVIFEWYLVQALFKTFRETEEETLGTPGIFKARNAWIKGDPLSHNRYLKNAPIFGFSGVYKRLANELDLISEDLLGENGDELLRIWAHEQNLSGYFSSDSNGSNCEGKRLRQLLSNAISLSLEKGEVYHKWNWPGLAQLAGLLAPYKAGKQEKRLLYSLLINDKKGFRQPLLTLLPEFLEKNESADWEEKDFHLELLKTTDKNLKELLQTIMDYESFCYILNKSFYELLYYLSDKNRKISVNELTEEPFAKQDIPELIALYEKNYAQLSQCGESLDFEKSFCPFSVIKTPKDFIVTLIQHHQRIQKKKPPFGKAPWLETFPDGSYMIRPIYRVNEPPEFDDSYVNRYRVTSLISFLDDLKSN